jgi:signal transduction histidine kinase
MKLTNRLSLFFLTALAVVLLGFCVSMYLFASWHLHIELQNRLEAAVNTLLAATEKHSDSVEWEPLGHQVTLGNDDAPDQVRWIVFDGRGKAVDASNNLFEPNGAAKPTDGDWLRIAQSISVDGDVNQPPSPAQNSVAEDLPSGVSLGPIPKVEHARPHETVQADRLLLVAAVSPHPLRASLWRLLLAMLSISAAIWLIAAMLGNWFCRKAIEPITRMSQSARLLRGHPTAASLLEVSTTNDELEELGVAFNELLGALRDALDQQRRFTGDASHQLRTPLTAMLTSVQVALRQTRSAAEYQHVLGVVERRGIQLQQIVEALLLLARIEANESESNAPELNLFEFCEARLSTWSEQVASHKLIFDASSSDDLTVRCQPVLLEQIILNLLDNSAKYSDPDKQIVLNLVSTSETAVLTLSDQGWGIPEQELAHVCEPFYRATQAKWTGKPGIGLGLAIVQRLISTIGARLQIESKIGCGSEFKITFPLSDNSRDRVAVQEFYDLPRPEQLQLDR